MKRGWTQLKKDDVVMVIAGKELGKSGKILKLLPKRQRVVVEKINMIKRHTKPTKQMPQGGCGGKRREHPRLQRNDHLPKVQCACSHREKHNGGWLQGRVSAESAGSVLDK